MMESETTATESDTTYKAIVDRLTKKNIDFKVTTHEPVKTSQEAATIRGVSLESGAKALLIRDTKTNDMFLTVMSASEQMDSKAFKKLIKRKNLKFASEEEVKTITGCLPGAVPPFGSIFELQTWVDESLIKQGETINFNCGLRTHSLCMKVEDYLKFENPTVNNFIRKV